MEADRNEARDREGAHRDPTDRAALVAGWFSFQGMGATVGDLLARDLCVEWLESAGWQTDIAVAAPFSGGVDWQRVNPAAYDVIVFVCGPFGNGPPVTGFLERFSGRRLIGLNLSMLEGLDIWNPFDALVERDSDRRVRPDISLLSKQTLVPVVGTVLVHKQQEYPGGLHEEVDAAVDRLLAARDVTRVAIDTRLDVNSTGLTSSGQIEALIARMDAVVTTRLHGTVLAIKNGVPPLVIDPIAGGRKVVRQAHALGWDCAFTADAIDDTKLSRALDYCLSADAKSQVAVIRGDAIEAAVRTKEEFMIAVGEA